MCPLSSQDLGCKTRYYNAMSWFELSTVVVSEAYMIGDIEVSSLKAVMDVG